jgi:hypothetical protein
MYFLLRSSLNNVKCVFESLNGCVMCRQAYRDFNFQLLCLLEGHWEHVVAKSHANLEDIAEK